MPRYNIYVQVQGWLLVGDTSADSPGDAIEQYAQARKFEDEAWLRQCAAVPGALEINHFGDACATAVAPADPQEPGKESISDA